MDVAPPAFAESVKVVPTPAPVVKKPEVDDQPVVVAPRSRSMEKAERKKAAEKEKDLQQQLQEQQQTTTEVRAVPVAPVMAIEDMVEVRHDHTFTTLHFLSSCLIG